MSDQTETETEEKPSWDDAAEASAEAQAELDEQIDAPGRVEKRRYTTDLEVELDDEDLAEMAREIADLCKQKDSLVEKKKASAKSFNDQIDVVDSDISERAAQVREGSVRRPVEVSEVWDEQQGAVLIFRHDVDPPACIERRAMTAAERQRDLGLEDATENTDDEGDIEPEDTEAGDQIDRMDDDVDGTFDVPEGGDAA